MQKHILEELCENLQNKVSLERFLVSRNSKMAGTKRTRSSSKKPKGGKVAKVDQSTEAESMHQLTPGNKSKQSRSRSKMTECNNNSNVITTSAQVIEDEQVFEFVTQGQMSDFQSKDGQTESDSGKLGMKGVTEAILNVDHEVSFSVAN